MSSDERRGKLKMLKIIKSGKIFLAEKHDFKFIITNMLIATTGISLRRQIKWTECKKGKRNSEKFNFELNLLLWFRINYSRNWECFDQSCVNWTKTVHGTLRVLCWSHLLYGICVKIFIMNQYISKSYTRSKNTILTDNIQSASHCKVNYY